MEFKKKIKLTFVEEFHSHENSSSNCYLDQCSKAVFFINISQRQYVNLKFFLQLTYMIILRLANITILDYKITNKFLVKLTFLLQTFVPFISVDGQITE